MKHRNIFIAFGLLIISALFALPTQAAPLAVPTNPGTTGLVSWWSLNEQSGTRSDSHGTNHLTDNNTVTYAAGVKDNAALFVSGNSEYLSGANSTLTSFTYATWVKLSSKTGYPTIAGQWDSTNNKRRWLLYYDQDIDRFSFWVSPTGLGTGILKLNADALGSPALNTWYYIAVSFASASQLTIQVDDGTANTLSTASAMYNVSQPFCIGAICNPTPAFFMNGDIDESALYSRVLTADEKTWLYNSATGRAYCEVASNCIATNTPSPTVTNTATATATNTATLTPTSTDTPTATFTGTVSPTNTFTNTPTPSDTPTFTVTPSFTPTITLTPTITNTPHGVPTWYIVNQVTYGEYALNTALLGLCGTIIAMGALLLTVMLVGRRKAR